MKRIDSKDIIAVVGSDGLLFATKDGEEAFILEDPLGDGTGFIALEGSERWASHGRDMVLLSNDNGSPTRAWNNLSVGTPDDEESWESEADGLLEDFGLKLGGRQRTPVAIDDSYTYPGGTYRDGWFKVEAL